MEILFVSHNLNFEGAPKLLYAVIKGLASKHEIAVLSHREGGLRKYFDSINVPVLVLRLARSMPNRPDFVQRVDEVKALIQGGMDTPKLLVYNTVECCWAGALASVFGIRFLGILHESVDPFISMGPATRFHS